MKKFNKKHILGLLIFALSFQLTNAQPVAKIGYFLDNATHKHLLNPALVPARGYMGYPALGSVDFGIQSNLKLSTFLFPAAVAGDPLLSFMHPNVTPEQFLSQLNPNNELNFNQRLSIASMGFYAKSSFWNFEVATRINGGLNLPYELFEFMKVGMSSESGNRYDMNNLTFGLDAMLEASLGSSFKIGDNIRFGFKGKYLHGLARISAGLDNLLIDMKPDEWTVNSTGMLNVYAPMMTLVTDADGYLDLEGTPFNLDTSNPTQSAGSGFALDLGVTWNPLKNVQLSAGIIDLGRVTWKQDFHQRAYSTGGIVFGGIDGIGGDNEDGIEEQLTNLQDGLLELANFRLSDDKEDLVVSLIPVFNAGLEVGVLSNKLTLGLLYSNYMIPENNQHELTGIVNLKPLSGFNIAASYTLVNSRPRSLGVAFGLNLGIANIFLACDYIPLDITPEFELEGVPFPVSLPIHSISTQIQAGVSLSLGKMKAQYR